MTKLREVCRLIRSKNAGPFELTFDIMFTDESTYLEAKNLNYINRELFTQIYGVKLEDGKLYAYDPAISFKITIPRLIISGALGDSDVYGCQQFAPLANLEIPTRKTI